MAVLWCITGAGHMLAETFEQMKRRPHAIYLSRAGAEVVEMYGLSPLLSRASEVVQEGEQGASFYSSGNVAMKEFDAVLVAPCTGNTAAKLALGIADTLATNTVSQALKSGVRVIALPTDAKPTLKTRLPLYISKERCARCPTCPPKLSCPRRAFIGKGRVSLLKCNACKRCISACPYGKISFGKEITITTRAIDRANVRALSKQGIMLIAHPRELSKGLK